MTKYDVEYQQLGESVLVPGKTVDYMLAVFEVKGKEVELYAEADPVKNQKNGTYLRLRDEITAQARDYGIPRARLQFKYDGVDDSKI